MSRGAQIQGAKLPGRLDFVWRRLMYVGPQYGAGRVALLMPGIFEVTPTLVQNLCTPATELSHKTTYDPDFRGEQILSIALGLPAASFITLNLVD